MEINLSEIVKSDGSEKSFQGQMNIEPVKYMGLTVTFDEDVEVNGIVRNIGGVLELEADVTGTLHTSCARCMKPVQEAFEAKVSETLMQEGAQAELDQDVILFSGYSLSVDEIVLNSILVSMPVRYLCKEDCKGLCPTCGKDLNDGGCSCSSDAVDPRFEVLSKLCDK